MAFGLNARIATVAKIEMIMITIINSRNEKPDESENLVLSFITLSKVGIYFVAAP